MERNWLDIVCLILIIIGAINWGLIGFFNFDLVSVIFGNMSMITRIIFAVVGNSRYLFTCSFLETKGRMTKKGLKPWFKSPFCIFYYKEITISSLKSSGICSASTDMLITKLILNLEEISFNLERTKPIYSSDTDEIVKKLSRYIASKS